MEGNGVVENFDAWLSKVEVMEKTGLTDRTLERKVNRGELRREYRNIPGRKPLPIFHPGEIAQLLQKTLTPFLLKRNARPESRQLITTETRPSVSLSPFFFHQKYYLTLKEAAHVSGLPLSYLRRQIRAGNLPAVKVNGWRVHRDDLRRHRVMPA